jgi:hypothetical protein
MAEPTPKPEHPLLAAEVIRRSGMDPAPTAAQLWADCPQCQRHQSLAEASVEPAADPQDITAYRCASGCAIVAVTGYPNPMPIPGSGRYRLGDFVLAPVAPSGLLVNMPSGHDVRLTPHVE